MGPSIMSESSNIGIEIINRINEGAALLEIGDFSAAINSFSAVLRATRTSLIHQQDAAGAAPAEGSSLDHFISIDKQERHKQHHECCLGCEDSTSPFVFRRPIRINKALLASQQYSEADVSASQIIAAIGIFNMALSMHLSATTLRRPHYGSNKQEGTAFTIRLQKAIKLYEFAFELHKSSVLSGEGSSVFFQLVILNNLANAHTQMGSHDVADVCCRQLLSILLFVIDTHGADQMPANVSLDCFLHNINYLIFTTDYSQAASAA